MEILLLLLLLLVMVVSQIVKIYWLVQSVKQQKAQAKSMEKWAYLMLRGTRARESRIRNMKSSNSTPVTDQPGERRRSG